jgi:predicted RNA binding protein YcfA (HicA-like mRNA interferase family)
MIDPKVDKEIRKLCCSNTRDVKYKDIRWIMTHLGFEENSGDGCHKIFKRKGYPSLTISNHKPFRPIYLKSLCHYLIDNNLWSPDVSKKK